MFLPWTEDGNNFGVALQVKVFELMTTLCTKPEGFHTQLPRVPSECGGVARQPRE